MFFNPNQFSVFDFLDSMLTAHFTKEEPAQKKEPETPMKVVWEIGPKGYLCGRCVPAQ